MAYKDDLGIQDYSSVPCKDSWMGYRRIKGIKIEKINKEKKWWGEN